MSLLSLQDAAFAYDTGVAVNGLSFHVNAGDYLCIVGENGSGKSTLMKGLLRLLQPVRGAIVYGDGLRGRDIGYLPQQTAAQKDFPASAYEVVLSGRLSAQGIRPFYTMGDHRLARQNMELLDVLDLEHRCYRELSGGQQQRVLLARALCATQRLLLLDEPVAGLDPIATQDLYRMVARINREQGIAVVMVSHDIRSAMRYASHILHLQGAQLFFGTRGEYAMSPVGQHFLGGEPIV